jgi:hypothetical protein
MRSAAFVGGELDGARLAIEGEPFPASIVVVSERYSEGYRYAGAHGVRCYRAQGAAGRRPFDDEAKCRFLEALATGVTVAAAATAVGFSSGPIYRARQLDPTFADRYAEARRGRT